MKIAVQKDRLEVGGRRGGAIRFADIAEVAAEKVGKVTYDEVFLVLREQSGEGVTLGELDEGFAEAEGALRAHLPGFPVNWWDSAEQSPIGVRTHVWPVPEAG